MTKDELLAAVWPRLVVEENNLSQAVTAIRRVLGDSRETPRYISTVAGRGYRFVATVQQAGAAQDSDVGPTPAHSRRHYGIWLGGAAALVVAAIGIGLLAHQLSLTGSPAAASRSRTAADRAVLAVLPFKTSANDAMSEALGRITATLIQQRLATSAALIVVGDTSAAIAQAQHADPLQAARSLRASYLLHGGIVRKDNGVDWNVRLVDAASGTQLWSVDIESSAADLGEVCDSVSDRVTESLHVPRATSTRGAPGRPVNLEAHELYVQAQDLKSKLTVPDTLKAAALFRRATILDPSFARAYLALAQSQVLLAGLRLEDSDEFSVPDPRHVLEQSSKDALVEVQQAIDRALELDPTLGEGWIEVAGLSRDPVAAEKLYRKGLALAPNYSAGYVRYSDFLFGQYRKGEALRAIETARAIDPLAPPLLVRHADHLMVTRNDLASSERLLHEALAIEPDFYPALVNLAGWKLYFTGEFAEALRYAERATRVKPQSDTSRYSAATIYLEVNEPMAALSAIGQSALRIEALVQIAQQRREPARAAALARSIAAQPWQLGPAAPVAEAVRDHAIATGEYGPALKLLEAQYGMGAPDTLEPRMWSRGLVLVYAHTLMLAGQKDRGRALVDALMAQIDSESVGRTRDSFSRERASAFAILGQDERALAELETSVRTGKLYRWWYLAELDPAFARLRRDPRFQALAARVAEHGRHERELLDEMRRNGEVPVRSR